ncbi:MAG TPA: tautomerase family protein [Candidatus Lokiarchaeia archaeon]|nr:tautomerase family protein [Candidatus Lokiarchaeia archaeon]
MPIARVDVIAGKSAGYKQALLDGIHDALVHALKIPKDDRNQVLTEHAAGDFERRAGQSDKFTIIEITMFKGRSLDAKRALYQRIVENLKKKPGIEGNDILIVLHEPPLENWGIHGGKAACDVDIGFKIDV